MERKELIEEIVRRTGELKRHAKLYYEEAAPEITDKEYDDMRDGLAWLVAELARLDPSNSALEEARSVLDGVGYTPSYGKKVQHPNQMGSLEKVNTFADLQAWFSKYSTRGGMISVTPKVDGCAVRINYEYEALSQAAVRGDGKIGNDVTDNIRRMGIPAKLSPISTVKSSEVRAEVVMPRSEFKRLNESGECSFKNPRNAGTGSLMAQDPDVSARRGLKAMAYDVIVDGVEFKTESDKRMWMTVNLPGFTLVESVVIPIEHFPALALEWEGKRPGLDYEIDGLVIALNSIEDQVEAGWNGLRPNGKIAWKFPAEQKSSLVESVDYQVGRTGVLTPMARIEPVLLGGSTISNITLHNEANVFRMNVCVGDCVLIEKAGDIIPEVVRVVNHNPANDHCSPTTCPSCGGPVEMDENKVNLWCRNAKCPAQLERRILHWVRTTDMKGVGVGIISGLCGRGYVADVPGLYFVSEQQLVNVTGGSVAARKALEAILGKNEIALAVFLDGLGIDGLGTSTSNEVAKTFKTLDCVLSATAPEFDALPDIGPLTAEKIVKGLSDMLDMIARMRQVIDIIDVREKVGPLKGMSFVLTGAMSKPRKTIEAAIEAAGGENKGSVSKGVTYLVQADASSTSSKTEKANKVGTKIISEVKLWEMMG